MRWSWTGRNKRGLLRGFAGALLLHFGLATFVIPMADATLSPTGPLHGPHLEVPGHEKCPPIHNHLNCSAFSTARLLAAPPRHSLAPCDDAAVAVLRASSLLGRPLAVQVPALGSRAPPLA